MTTTSSTVTAADQARALAVLLHFLAADRDGINAVLQEATDVERTTPLLMAVLSVTVNLQPAVAIPEMQESLRASVAMLRQQAATC